MSFAAYMSTDGGKSFATNALRFETFDEAEGYARDLFGRWMAVTNFEVRETQDAVNYKFENGKANPIAA